MGTDCHRGRATIPCATTRASASLRQRGKKGDCDERARSASAQQHEHGAAAARVLRSFAVREHVVPVREPAAYLALEHGLAVGRGESLAVDHANAAEPALTRIV